MARIVGGITASHIPAIGNAIAKGLAGDPYWSPFFDGFPPVRAWLDRVKPDVAVVLYNDHGLNFFLDKMPTFAVGAAAQYSNADEGWGIPTVAPFAGDQRLSWHLIEGLVRDEFDICSCQEMLVDHAFTVPMQLFWPQGTAGLRTVPISFNTVQHPIPSPARCYRFGQALGRAIASYPQDLRVVLVATGGLSHQLDGTRAGFINKAFDEMCLEKIVDRPEELTTYSSIDLVREAGAQGAEFVMWLAMRGALTGTVRKLHSNYHIPISNTATGVLLLENTADV
jgi:protocatechuate 4,5-dioxygenase beta chain